MGIAADTVGTGPGGALPILVPLAGFCGKYPGPLPQAGGPGAGAAGAAPSQLWAGIRG